MRYFVIAAVAILVFAGASTSSEARSKARVVTNAEQFAKELASSGQFEIQSSTLALQKSNNEAIKKFAQKMIHDHTAAGEKLKETLKKDNLPEPTEGVEEHQEMLNKLIVANGIAFDRTYIEDQRQAHQEAVALLETYSKRGDNNDLKQLASTLLPTIKEHLQLAEGLSSGETARR